LELSASNPHLLTCKALHQRYPVRAGLERSEQSGLLGMKEI